MRDADGNTVRHLMDGVMVKERCPRCRRRLMKNRVGAEWCSGDECQHYTRNGKQVKMSKEVFETAP